MENQAEVMKMIRAAMPGVARQVTELRRVFGDPHVTDCIVRSFRGEPGHFFAREGALAVGTPWDGDPQLTNFAATSVCATQALVILRNPTGAAHG